MFKNISKKIALIVLIAFFIPIIVNFTDCEATILQPTYDSYLYDVWGRSVPAPDGYTLDKIFVSKDINGIMPGSIEDIMIGSNGNLYVLDSGTGRIIILDEDLNVKNTIDKFFRNGNEISIVGATGIFVNEKENVKNIYIANTEFEEVIICDEEGQVMQTLLRPESDLMPEGGNFNPTKIVVDDQDTVFVLVKGLYLGSVVYDKNGNFTSFYGSNKLELTTTLLVDFVWKKFLNSIQREKMSRYVPIEYLGFGIDDKNFILTVTGKTVNSLDQIKRLNAKGINVLESKTYGDIESAWINDRYIETSFIDVCTMNSGNFAALDATRGRVFIYDEQGNLLSIFGGLGKTIDRFESPTSIDAYNNNIYVADKSKKAILLFTPTQYGENVLTATELYNNGKYEECINLWNQVIMKNGGYSTAFIGLGKAYMGQNSYKQAMNYFKLGFDRESYSEAYEQYRREIIKDFFPIVFILLVAGFAVIMFSDKIFVSKQTKSTALNTGTFSEISHFVFHPSSGYTNIKKMNTNKIWIFSLIVLFAWFMTSILKRQQTGFIFNFNRIDALDLRTIFLSTIVLFAACVISNWLICTMFDGKGKIIDIVSVSSLSMIPYVSFGILGVIISNVVILDERYLLTIIAIISIIWSLALLISGMMIIHEYSFKKTIISILTTIVGVLILAFLTILGMSLIGQILLFISTIWKEISFSI